MEYKLRPWVSWSFLQNNNRQVVKKMEWIENRKSKKYEKIQTKPLRIRMKVYVFTYMLV